MTSVASTLILLKPDRIFGGHQVHEGWIVLVEGNRTKNILALKNVTFVMKDGKIYYGE